MGELLHSLLAMQCDGGSRMSFLHFILFYSIVSIFDYYTIIGKIAIQFFMQLHVRTSYIPNVLNEFSTGVGRY
jgi:hypothetical protein